MRIGELLERVGPVAERAVDRYELAASLESDGVTDDVAREIYGCPDVFELAGRVWGQAQDAAIEVSQGPAPKPSSGALRDIAHGLLYLLPATVFPVGIALLDRTVLVAGVIGVGVVGWVWSGVAAWLAYQFLGRSLPDSAARVLRWSALAGIPIAAATAGVIITATGATTSLLAVAVGQMAFQVASGLFMFYRREVLLYVSMAPGVMAGTAFLVIGERALPAATAVICGSLALAFGLALLQTRDRGDGREPALLAGMRRDLRQLPVVLLYIVLSAAFLLNAQSRFMLEHFEVLVGFLPLIAGMGVVEWRARRFSEQSAALLHSVRYPREFISRVWVLLGRNAAFCAAAVGGLSVVLIVVMQVLGVLTVATVVLTVAGVLLAVAYLVGFLLANMGWYGWLSGSLGLCTFIQVVLMSTGSRAVGPLVETEVVLASVLLLLVLYGFALAELLGQVRTFR